MGRKKKVTEDSPDKQMFIKYMERLKSFYKLRNETGDSLGKLLFSESFIYLSFGEEFMNHYIELLEDVFGDKNSWIQWFIFENDWGAKGYEAGFTDKMSPIKTTEDLYDLIKSVS